MLSFRSRKRRAPDLSGADALAAAESLERAGRRIEAVAMLTDANRTRRDPAIEERLVALRHEAFVETDAQGGPGSWPPVAPELFADAVGLPEIAAGDLSAAAVGSGIVRHGGIVVRGLIPPARVSQLIDDIDHTFAAHDAFHEGAPVSDTAPWYVPFEPKGGNVGEIRHWVREGGGVLTTESPRTMFDVLDVFDEVGLVDSLSGYLGERPALSVKKWTLRRVPISQSGDWHQDGAFLGEGIRTVNVWVTLTHCGDDAPGLDVVPTRMGEILPTGTEGAWFDWSVGHPVVERAAVHAPIQRPIFEPGDAVLFDDYFLHRTAIADDMQHERYAIESWFFAPSHYPLDQIPVVV